MYRTLYGQPPETVDEQRGKPRPEIDVAFIGESIVEAMDGRWLGKKIVRAVSRNSEGEDHKRPDIGKVIDMMIRKIGRPEHAASSRRFLLRFSRSYSTRKKVALSRAWHLELQATA